MKFIILSSLLLSFLQLSIVPPAYANKDAMARAQFILRQVSAEKVKLTAENKKLQLDKIELEKKLNKIEKKYKTLTQKATKKSSKMNKRMSDLNRRFNDEVDAHKITSKKLSEIKDEKNRLFNVASNQLNMINLCVANNKKLYTVNQQLLGQYEDKGVWGALSQAEPLTGLKQVEIENLIDDYQYRLDDLRVEVIQAELQPNL